jgi:outer membrane receptor protein involved in Fe transport
MRPLRSLLAGSAAVMALTALIAVVPGHATAQTLSGTVVEAATGAPIEAARVVLLDVEGEVRQQTLTRSDGHFALDVPAPGRWSVRVEVIGYRSVRSDVLDVRPAEWLVLEVALVVEAVALEPIVVTARRIVGSPDIQRFYDRRDRAIRSGMGQFIVREEIERLSPQRPSDLLRSTPGVRVVRARGPSGQAVRMAGGCTPAIYIDGMRINRTNLNDSLDDYLTVLDIEGIEIYRGPSSQLNQYHDPSGCGLILAWTRAGVHDPENSFRWRTVFGAAALLAVFMLLFN